MRLDEVASLIGVSAPETAKAISVTDLVYSSSDASHGAVFFCIRGAKQDGHEYAQEAVRRGAVAVVSERELGSMDVPVLVVSNSREAMNNLAAPFFGNPSEKLRLAGITGTNGKTTTSFMIESAVRASGQPAGLIGTVEVRVGDDVSPGIRTTPEAVDLQRLFSRMLDDSVEICAMEVTSEGIEAGRIEGTAFDVAIFTNLSQDHLNAHGTMEGYFSAKRKLFTLERTPVGLINVDDDWGRRLIDETEVEVCTFSLKSESSDVVAQDVALGMTGSRFRVKGHRGRFGGLDVEVEIKIPGLFNVYNALAAMAGAHLLGIDTQSIVAGLSSLEGVQGRFEPVLAGQDFAVIVDYAHTPDSLANVLRTARGFATGRVIAVFGCGGDRDRGKRPLMGRVAADLADVVFVTSDNPRGEDPIEIIKEIEEGIASRPPSGGYEAMVDREVAIKAAVALARRGDAVVIAGKGHETGQEIGGSKIPFDDKLVAARAIRNSREAGSS